LARTVPAAELLRIASLFNGFRIVRLQRLLDRLKHLAVHGIGWCGSLDCVKHAQQQAPVARIEAAQQRLLDGHEDIAQRIACEMAV